MKNTTEHLNYSISDEYSSFQLNKVQIYLRPSATGCGSLII
ncbi:hypothetical protein [Scytonema sp. NUACC26]